MPQVYGAKELKARLSSSPEGVYFFFGEEEHLKQVYLARFRAQITEYTEFNVTKLTVNPESALSEVENEIGQVSFFSARRFIEVRGFPLHQLNEKEAEHFSRLLSSVSEDLILIFYFFECDLPFNGTIPRTQKKLSTLPAYKALPDNVVVVHFTHPTLPELFAYYDAKFKSRGVRADRATLELFAARAGQDMHRMENESEKFIALALCADGVVTREMIDDALPEENETVLYKLSDAIECRDARRALCEYAILRQMKFDPIPLLATVSRAVANLHLAHGTLSQADAEKLFGMKAFRYKALCERAKKCLPEDLILCQNLCLETDRKLKNTSLDGDVLLQGLIVRICSVLKGEK